MAHVIVAVGRSGDSSENQRRKLKVDSQTKKRGSRDFVLKLSTVNCQLSIIQLVSCSTQRAIASSASVRTSGSFLPVFAGT